MKFIKILETLQVKKKGVKIPFYLVRTCIGNIVCTLKAKYDSIQRMFAKSVKERAKF
jgi:hypothetical protein